MDKPKRHRSPNFPSVDLERAVQRVTALYAANKRHPVPIGVAQKMWDYKEHSSTGNQCVAALKSYGLIDVQGLGDHREVNVSESAWKVVAEHSSRNELIKLAALAPPIFKELWDKFSGEGDLPSDGVIEHYLKFDRKEGTFNEDSVGDVIARFKSTVAFAKLTDCGIIEADQDDSGDREDAPLSVAELPPANRIKGRPVKAQGTKQDVFTLDEGEAVLQWPAELTAASFEDLSDWLKLALRKIGRSISDKAPAPRMTITAHEAVEALSGISSDEARAALEPCSDLEAD